MNDETRRVRSFREYAFAAMPWLPLALCAMPEFEDVDFTFDRAAERRTPRKVVRAIEVCSGCPVRRECLDYALSETGFELIGIWGGTSHGERRAALPFSLSEKNADAPSKDERARIADLLESTLNARLDLWRARLAESNGDRDRTRPRSPKPSTRPGERTKR